MKKVYLALFSLITTLVCVFSVNSASANRGAAAELAYKWVSDSTYLITYTYYRDCGGATAEPANVRMCYFNTCNTDQGSIVMNKKTPLSSNGTVVPSSTCAGGAPSTTCSSPTATLKGFRKWVYEGTVTLPSRCGGWKFAVSVQARNAGITNYSTPASSNNLYTEASLNNITAPTASSPTFSTDLIQYMCAGVPQTFDYSGVDADGDLLTYTLIDPQTAADNQTSCTFPPTPASYSFGGASPGTSLVNNPFGTGTTYSMTNGAMSFTPAAGSNQQAQMTMLITKRRGTTVVGYVMRDIQFIISTGCVPNSVTYDSIGTTSSAVLFLANNRPRVCPNAPHRLCYRISSPDASVTISNVTDNHLTFSPTSGTSTLSAPGYNGVGTNNVFACLNWTPTEADEGIHKLVIKSDVCRPGSPIVHRVDTIYYDVVLTLKAVATDTFFCLGDTSYLCAKPDNLAGANYTWGITSSGSGTTTGTLGIKSANDPCTQIAPSVTTTYLVETDGIPGICPRKDIPSLNTNQAEVKVVVVNPKIDAGPDTVMCTYSQLQLNSNLLNPQPELTYKYRWSPARLASDPSIMILNDSTVASPILKFPAGMDIDLIPDSIVFTLTVTPNPAGECAPSDKITVHFLKAFYILTGDTLQADKFGNPLITGLGYKHRQKGVSDTAICDGKSVVLQGWRDASRGATKDSTYTWIWNPSSSVSTPTEFTPGVTTLTPPGPGVHTWSLTAFRSGCPDSVKKITLVVDPNPTVDIGPDRSICFGDTIQMAAAIVPDPADFPQYYGNTDSTYRWYPGGSIFRADTIATYFSGYRSEKIYFEVQTKNAHCKAKDSVMYTVTPRAFLTIGKDTSICPGDTAQLHVTGDNLLKTITWKPITNIDSVHGLDPKVTPTFPTTYVVIGTDSNQCVDSASVKVNVFPRTVIYLPDSATVYPGESYQLDPRSNGLYYSWYPLVGFIDVNDSNLASPRITPLLNTTYRLRVVSDAGCVAEDSIYVFVQPDSYIDMPNAFMPGSGGVNAKFKPVHLGTASLVSMKIFNRWGVKMFETANIEEGWDGTFNGQAQPLGVYVYTIEAVSATGRKITKQGNVTLIR